MVSCSIRTKWLSARAAFVRSSPKVLCSSTKNLTSSGQNCLGSNIVSTSRLSSASARLMLSASSTTMAFDAVGACAPSESSRSISEGSMSAITLYFQSISEKLRTLYE